MASQRHLPLLLPILFILSGFTSAQTTDGTMQKPTRTEMVTVTELLLTVEDATTGDTAAEQNSNMGMVTSMAMMEDATAGMTSMKGLASESTMNMATMDTNESLGKTDAVPTMEMTSGATAGTTVDREGPGDSTMTGTEEDSSMTQGVTTMKRFATDLIEVTTSSGSATEKSSLDFTTPMMYMTSEMTTIRNVIIDSSTEHSMTTQPGDSVTTQGFQVTTVNGTSNESQTDPLESGAASISVFIIVHGEEFDKELGDTSSSEFKDAAMVWEIRIEMAYCNATSDIWDGNDCPITSEVTMFSMNFPEIRFYLEITHPNMNVVDNLVEFILNAYDIEILDDNGVPYNMTVSDLDLVTEAPSTLPDAVFSDLTCYTCSADDLMHDCSIGGRQGMAFPTEMCMVGESCLTFKNSNETHISIVRKCASTAMHCNNMNMDAMSCKDAQTTGMECSRCCDTDKCNHLDAGSSRPIPAILLLLVALFTAFEM